MFKRYKSVKGITLVALVVTIIILLILAGITISQLTESGLFEKAKLAKEKAEQAELDEQEKLQSYIDAIDGKKLPENTQETEAGTEVTIEEGWGAQTVKYVKTSNGAEVTELTKVSTVYAVSVGNGETVPIPYGFYYVGGTKDTGVVISDDSRDKNKYTGEPEVPAGAIYDTTTGIVKAESALTEDEKKTVIFGNQFVWIPCTLSEYTKYNFGKTNASGWDTSTNTAEKTQIQKYGGFYIGRYEAGASDITFANNYTLTTPTGTSSWQNANFTSSKVTDGKIATKAGQIPYFHSDYTTAIAMSEAML